MNIYIKIEILNREFESRLLLAFFAAQKKHKIIIANESYFRKAAKLNILKPGIIIDKSILPKPDKINEIKFFKSKGFKFYSIDEEAGITYENYDYFGKIRYGDETLEDCDGVFNWGKFDHDFLINYFTKFKNKFFITGNPRVDMWQSIFDDYYLDKNLKKLNYIFIPSSFGSFLSEKRFWNRIEVRRRNNHFINGVDEYKLYDIESNSLQLTKEFIRMIRHLLKKYSNINIILRPHSYENKDAWQKLIGDYKNLKIINKDGISKWIRNAKIIIHNGCTSGMEASFSKKNVIAYVPYENKLIRNIPNECSTIVNDLASLDKEVENAYYNNKIPTNNNSEKILSNRFKNYNNELAVLKILKIIENNSDNSLSKKNNLFLINIFSNLINLKIYIRNLFRFNKIDTNSLKFMKFNNSNIKQTIDGFYKIFQNMKKINIKKISSRVIFIELEK